VSAKRRRNDAPWRNACIALYGDCCANCYATGCQMDHMIGRGQGGPSVVENGLPLCGPGSSLSPFPGGCHQAKTDGKLKIRPEWLWPDQVAWLAENGHATWHPDTGEVSGRHMKVFADDRRAAHDTAPAIGAR
jgi:hypothetical protein